MGLVVFGDNKLPSLGFLLGIFHWHGQLTSLILASWCAPSTEMKTLGPADFLSLVIAKARTFEGDTQTTKIVG